MAACFAARLPAERAIALWRCQAAAPPEGLQDVSVQEACRSRCSMDEAGRSLDLEYARSGMAAAVCQFPGRLAKGSRVLRSPRD